MIKFRCKNCGQKISAPEVHAGKKGKCPKCKNPLVVPRIKNAGSANDRKNLTSSKQLNSSPPVSDLRLKKEPPVQISEELANSFSVEQGHEQMDETEKPPTRKLPWLLDIFLYPISMSGLVNLGIFWALPILFGFMQRLLPIPLIWWLAELVVAAYMYYYFMECIRDSAKGAIRAPENISTIPGISDTVSQAMEIIASIVIFWGPVAAYSIYKIFWQQTTADPVNDLKTDVIYWLLLGYGIFFFPMGLLAIAMFNSSSAFNPFIWIASIFSTFFQYCGLVLFFCIIVWLVSRIVSSFQQSLFFAYSFGAVSIYLMMVAAHLLGRFYYRNCGKLNWEV